MFNSLTAEGLLVGYDFLVVYLSTWLLGIQAIVVDGMRENRRTA